MLQQAGRFIYGGVSQVNVSSPQGQCMEGRQGAVCRFLSMFLNDIQVHIMLNLKGMQRREIRLIVPETEDV